MKSRLRTWDWGLWTAAAALVCGCYDPYPRRAFDDEWERARNLPPPDGNIRVRVDTFEVDEGERTAFGMAAAYRDANVTVVGSAGWSSNGLVVWAGTSDLVARFSADTRRFRTRKHSQSSITVIDGGEASMAVVQELPVVVTHAIPVYDGAVVVRTITVAVTGTGFQVRPRKTAGGRVDLEITPWVRDLRRGVIVMTELSTRLTVQSGCPVAILQHETSRDTLGTFFFSRGRSRVLMVVTADAP